MARSPISSDSRTTPTLLTHRNWGTAGAQQLIVVAVSLMHPAAAAPCGYAIALSGRSTGINVIAHPASSCPSCWRRSRRVSIWKFVYDGNYGLLPHHRRLAGRRDALSSSPTSSG